MAQISNSAIIILCIVGAGVALLIGWAIGHHLHGRDDSPEERTGPAIEQGFTQYEYMRGLRERTKEDIFAGNWGRQKRPRQQNVPYYSTTDLSGHSQPQSSHY